MPNKITVTGTVGPGLTETAQVFNNVTSINFQLNRQVLQVFFLENASQNEHHTEIDLYGIATVTYTIGTHLATVVAST